VFVKLTADSAETQIWCSKMYLWFCNIFVQKYVFTLHINRKLRVHVMGNLTLKEIPQQRTTKCCLF